jgi:hypothetical protein
VKNSLAFWGSNADRTGKVVCRYREGAGRQDMEAAGYEHIEEECAN